MGALHRIAFVLITTSVLFLTLALVSQACPEPCGDLRPATELTTVVKDRRTELPAARSPGRSAAVLPASSMADLSIVKSDANPSVRPGGTLTYRVFYDNGGDLPATDVVITDTLPNYTTHVYNGAGSQGWTTTISGTLVIWHRDVISPTVNGAFDVVIRVSDDAPAGATLINRVDIATTAGEDNTANNTWTTQPTVVRVADVRVTKTGPTEVRSGDNLTYTIQYANEGSEPADTVIITDTLPAGVSYVSSSGTLGSPSEISGQQVIWQAGTLLPAAGGSLTLVGAVDPDQASYSTLTNSVTIGTQTPERDFADNTATSAAVVRAGPPTTVQVTVPATVAAGTALVFATEVLDRWANPVVDDTPVSFASSALITTDLSAVTVSGVASATLNAGTQVGSAVITATAGSVTGTGTLDVVPGLVGELDLTSEVATQTVGEPVGLRAEAFDGYGNPVDAGIPVSFTTTLGDVQPAAGATDATGVVTATLTATQTGTSIVTAYAAGFRTSATVLFTPGPPENVSVTADPPAVVVDGASSQIRATIDDHYGNRVGDGITVTFASSLGTVNPMTVTTVAGRATTVLRSGPIHGQASVTATVGAYTGTAQVQFLSADLRIQSTHSPIGEIPPGTTMTYTITFENAGAAVARNVIITDTLPVALVDTWFQSSGAVITATEGTTYTWAVENLSQGEGGTIVLHGRFDRQYPWPSSQFVANVAAIRSATAEGNPADNTTSAGNLILTADVFIQSHVDDGGTILEPGGKIKYQVFLGNYGPAVAQGLTVTSTLPAYTSLWQETSYQIPGLTRMSAEDAPVQVWRFDGVVDNPNFGNFVIWLNIDPDAPGGLMLRNRIEVSSETPEADYANNVQVLERRVAGVNLECALSGPDEIVPGQMITYTLRYTNTGTLPAEGVILSDTLPTGIALIDVSRTPALLEPDYIEWELGSVADGQWEQIVVVGRVGTGVSAGQTLRNALSITTTSAESFTEDNASEVGTLVIPDAPDSLTLEMDTTTMATGARKPMVTTVMDQFGNPISGLTVTLTATVGIVTPTVGTTVQGTFEAMFVAPTVPSAGTVSASAAGLSDRIEVKIEPGSPARLRLETTANELPADGESTAIVRAYVTDEYGNPVKDSTPVTFDTNLGTLYNGESRHQVGTFEGLASTTLTAGHSAGEAVVIASAGTASAQVKIDFVALPTHEIYLPFIARGYGGD